MRFKAILTGILTGILAASILITSTAIGISANGLTTDLTTSGDTTVILTYGDIDNDGKITASDALFALRYSVGLENFTNGQKVISDVDNDNKTTSSDALEILRYSVGLKTTGKIGTKYKYTYSDKHNWVKKTETVVTKEAYDETVWVDTDVYDEPEIIKSHYAELVFEKCAICGEEVLYKIHDPDQAWGDSSHTFGPETGTATFHTVITQIRRPVNDPYGAWEHAKTNIEEDVTREKYTCTFHTANDYWNWDWGHTDNCWTDGEPHITIETHMDVYWDEYSGGGAHKEKVQKTVHHDAETTTKIYWYCPDCGEKVYQNNKPSY